MNRDISECVCLCGHEEGSVRGVFYSPCQIQDSLKCFYQPSSSFSSLSPCHSSVWKRVCVCVSVLSLPNGTCATGRLHNIARFFCLCLVDVYLPFSPVFCRVARSVYSFLAKSETDIEDYIYYIGFPGEK